MRRLARFVFTALAAGSLAACVGACVLWARSYSAAMVVAHVAVSWDGGASVVRRQAAAAVSRGEFVYTHSSRTREYPDAEAARIYVAAVRGRPGRYDAGLRFRSTTPGRLNLFGFTVTDLRVARVASRPWESGYEWVVIVPGWLLAPPLAVLPGVWVYGWRRRRAARGRAAAGLCLKCGYDLRATPGRCPECGTAAANA